MLLGPGEIVNGLQSTLVSYHLILKVIGIEMEGLIALIFDISQNTYT